MRFFFIFSFLLINLVFKAQDSIYKKNGEVIVAKILEVNIKEISYKRFDLLDGPLFITNKTEVKKIKYANGVIDSFENYNAPHVIENKPLMDVYTINKEFNMIQLSYRKGVYRYQDRHISDRGLLFLAEQKNRTLKNEELDFYIHESKKNKGIQYGFGWGGFGLSVAGLMGCGIAAEGSTTQNDQAIIVGFALTSAAVFITSQILSYQFKLKRISFSNKVADLYNEY